ncbi:MAG TPA: acetyl-CoA carboxylase biotin carboxyl carrier protein [Candidatus Contendobacter sp.]|nr:acetyl-CoA carboxylase biotin carboxyl carrier protein [Candidatus Contendobacter sp.]HRZ23950.1 acetyl-CoA carboxylase biotin carboxyl carrier protein [Candidatus Contendobacter sp.]HRZ52126.1 acetyl-CoA carboxylase biotin carboxyl carrier protein [Candidatus Contendobacter sp.]
MDIRKIKKLIELLESSAVAEIEIKEGEDSVRISRHPQGGASVMMPSQPLWAAPAAYGFAPAAPVMPVPASPAPPAPAPVPDAEAIPGHVLRSPMVGTFYRSAAPGGKPFVEIGQPVNVGDPVCIIEAMKMFNQIEADRAGTVTRILAENGQPVEYDQPLLVIE